MLMGKKMTPPTAIGSEARCKISTFFTIMQQKPAKCNASNEIRSKMKTKTARRLAVIIRQIHASINLQKCIFTA